MGDGLQVVETPASRTDTLWIFDADFEDLVGDNAGWTTYDRTGTFARTNYWHKDTIRMEGYPYLGDSSWWCGTRDDCWAQGRGYGNDWTCSLWRGFPEINGRPPGEVLFLEYDQRYAMENDYDYGYVDVSSDGGNNWTTVNTVDNPGFVGHPGTSQDWDSADPVNPGHMVIDLTDYVGTDLAIRFRFESDPAYSSQDQPNNPPFNSCLDGAWQLDNIKLWGGHSDSITHFFDDCESPGDNGWMHDDLPASGQVGIVYERREESFDGHSGWMMGAYDEAEGVMVDGQDCWLWSPPIDVSGVSSVIGRWEGWLDLPTSDDAASVRLHTSDSIDCLYRDASVYAVWGAYGGPAWVDLADDWSSYTDDDYLLIDFRVWNSDPTPVHGAGMIVNRVRVGVPMETGVPEDSVATVALGRPHPNPFTGETSFALSTPVSGDASVQVIDVAGRVVKTLIHREVGPGEHPLSWDGRTDAGLRAASGVYFVRAELASEAGAQEAILKLILID